MTVFVGRDLLALLTFLADDFRGLDTANARLWRQRQTPERAIARQELVIPAVARYARLTRAIGLNTVVVAGADHEIFLVLVRGGMLLNRDEAPGKQGGSIAAGVAATVHGLLRLEPELGELLALVLLIILAGIVIDFELRPRVVLRALPSTRAIAWGA